MEFSNLYERDYFKYRTFVKERKFLFEDNKFKNLERIYIKLYTISELLYLLDGIDKKSMIGDFSKELKNSLVISFDLLNMNYLNSSKQILRSSIESFFRLSLSILRFYEYRKNISNKIYGSTDSLKKLKSLYTGQAVYRLTSGTINYFEDTDIISTIKILNACYSELSGNVHVNATTNFSPQKFLEDYSKFDNETILNFINFYLEVINCIAIALFYLLKVLDIPVTKRQIQVVEMGLNNNMELVLNKIF